MRRKPAIEVGDEIEVTVRVRGHVSKLTADDDGIRGAIMFKAEIVNGEGCVREMVSVPFVGSNVTGYWVRLNP